MIGLSLWPLALGDESMEKEEEKESGDLKYSSEVTGVLR